MFSLFPPCPDREPVLKASNFFTPGHFLSVTPANGEWSQRAVVQERAFWEMNFPDQGAEERGENPNRLVDDFEKLLLQAVEERLRADVPVGAYLSGGVDSSMILALACQSERAGDQHLYRARARAGTR